MFNKYKYDDTVTFHKSTIFLKNIIINPFKYILLSIKYLLHQVQI